MFKNIFLLLLLALSLQAKEVSLLLPWKNQFQFAGYFMAQKKGFYKEVGLDVKIKEFDAKRNNVLDVSTQKAEFGIRHSTLILDKLTQAKNIKLLAAIYQSSPLVLISQKSMHSLSDIMGKKVIMSFEDNANAAINAMILSAGIPKNSFTPAPLSFTLDNFINKSIDFRTVFRSNELYTLKKKCIAYNLYDPKEHGYDFYSDILFTSQEFIQKDPKTVQNFVNASLHGWRYAFKHIDESVDVILKYYNTQHKTKEALLYEAKVLKKIALVKDTPLGNINPIRLEEIANTYRLLGLIKTKEKLDFDDFVYKVPKIMSLEAFEKSLLALYAKYNSFIHLFLLFTFLFVFSAFYIHYKLKKSFNQKTEELKKTYDTLQQNTAILATDTKGTITYISDAFCKLSGYTKEELLGQNPRILKNKDDTFPLSFYKKLWKTITNDKTWKGELHNLRKDGNNLWLESVITPLYDKDEKIIGFESISHDVSIKKVLAEFNKKLKMEVEEKTQALQKLAHTDALTGAYNRIKIDTLLIKNKEYFQEHSENFALIMIDIDYFKNVNDTHGHLIGDEVLKSVVTITQESIRSSDILGRWGGEEFMVICPHTDKEAAYFVAETIRKHIESYSFQRVKNLTISAGVSDIGESITIQKLIDNADTALYRAKKHGRNRVEK